MGNSDQRPAVLILGGGPAGLMTAFRIVTAGATAVLIERGRHDAIRIGEHLPPDGVALARRAGVAGLDDDAHVKCPGVSAWWGGDSPHHMDYLFHPIGHGLNLSRPHFDSCLAEQCRRAGARILTDARLVDVARTPRGWRAHVRCGAHTMEYEARLVVDATGSAAAFARLQGSSIEACRGQIALVASRSAGSAGQPARRRLVIEAAEDGWWYFAPLSGGRCVCMFMTDADLVPAREPSTLDSWNDRMQRTLHVRPCLDDYPALASFTICSARSQRLDRMCGRDWVAAGDAAMAFDPLSSRGIAKGVEHGCRTADAVLACLDGDDAALDRLSDRFAVEFADYEQMRRAYYSTEDRWPQAPFWRRRQLQEAVS